MRAEGLKSLYCILKTPTDAERETGSFSWPTLDIHTKVEFFYCKGLREMQGRSLKALQILVFLCSFCFGVK
jgi:hypothetical protein